MADIDTTVDLARVDYPAPVLAVLGALRVTDDPVKLAADNDSHYVAATEVLYLSRALGLADWKYRYRDRVTGETIPDGARIVGAQHEGYSSWTLTAAGASIIDYRHAIVERSRVTDVCCGAVVAKNCVCAISTVCLVHGGACHGTHD